MNFSVLMTVYAGDVPSYLAEALHSLHTQTLLPTELCLVCDGPLCGELDRVINHYCSIAPFRYNIHRMPDNRGLPTALNEGIRITKYPVIARMDADDYSYPDRLATQIAYLQRYDLDFVYCNSAEFTEAPSHPERIKPAPVPEALGKVLGYRNPLAHPSIVCRKAVYEELNGYRAIPYFEDYDLYLRVVASNFRTGKSPGALVGVRVSHWADSRRVGLKYLKHGISAKSLWMGERLVNRPACLLSLIPFTVFALGPKKLREYFYRRLRKSIVEPTSSVRVPRNQGPNT